MKAKHVPIPEMFCLGCIKVDHTNVGKTMIKVTVSKGGINHSQPWVVYGGIVLPTLREKMI